MKQCPSCGAQLDDDSFFCAECGKPITQMNVCPNCSNVIKPSDEFCQNCGSKINAPIFSASPRPNPVSASKKMNIWLIIVLIVFVTTMLLFGICGGIWYYRNNKNTPTINEVATDSIAEVVDSIIISDLYTDDQFVDAQEDEYADGSNYDYYESNKVDEELNKEEYDEAGNVKESEISTDQVFDGVEEMPQFPGGSSALFEYLAKNIKYPVVAEEHGVQGSVVVSIVVERDGSITDVKVVKSVDPSLDKEALRVVKSMPNWIPGKLNGNLVRVKYTVPITFRLQ